MKLRLLQGMEAKAKRGELIRVLAPGYECDLGGNIVHGVLAPNARLRSEIIPSAPVNANNTSADPGDAPLPSAPVRISWARLLKRVFDIDIGTKGTLILLLILLRPPARPGPQQPSSAPLKTANEGLCPARQSPLHMSAQYLQLFRSIPFGQPF